MRSAPGPVTGRARVSEAAPGPGDGTSQGCRRGYGPARAGIALWLIRLWARETGRAYAVSSRPGERDEPMSEKHERPRAR